MQKDVRWKQRFQNFERAFVFFNKSCKLEIYDELQGAGLVQSFEFTFELAWKTLKDYLQDQGLVREAYKHWTNGSYPRTSKYHTHYRTKTKQTVRRRFGSNRNAKILRAFPS